MSKKEQFLTFVLVGATAHDVNHQLNDAQMVVHTANLIPEAKIPDNVMNAAKVFLAYSQGTLSQPHGWMLATEGLTERRRRT